MWDATSKAASPPSARPALPTRCTAASSRAPRRTRPLLPRGAGGTRRGSARPRATNASPLIRPPALEHAVRVREVLEHRGGATDCSGTVRVAADSDGDVAVGRPLARPYLPGHRQVRVRAPGRDQGRGRRAREAPAGGRRVRRSCRLPYQRRRGLGRVALPGDAYPLFQTGPSQILTRPEAQTITIFAP